MVIDVKQNCEWQPSLRAKARFWQSQNRQPVNGRFAQQIEKE